MDNFARTEKFIRERPEDAQALAAEWQAFANHNPGILPTNTRLLAGRDIVEAYFYIRDEHEETQMRNEGSVDLSRVPQSVVGFPAIVAIAFQRSKIMQHDDNYIEIEEKLKNEWLAKNPGKDFTSKEGLDYLHGSLDNNDAASLRKDAEKTFRDNPKYQKRVERYDREKTKVYKNIDNDPSVSRLKTEIEEHTEARGGDPDGIIQKKSWEKFAQENPDKAKSYAQINPDIKKAHEKQEIKKQLAEMEQKTGRQVRYVEKIHRPQGMSPEEAARRLESIKPSQPQREENQDSSSNINIRQITKQLDMQAKEEAHTARPQRPTGTSQAERFIDRNISRGIDDFGGGRTRMKRRLAGRAGNMAGKLSSRAGKLSGRAGKMLGKFAFQIGTKLVANPWGLLIIGIIILIVLLVLFIMMRSDEPKPVPTLEGCLDENGNTIVKNGNECAANLASFYSNEEGNPDLTAKCVDKCTNFNDATCNRNASNTCDFPFPSCGAGAHLQVFCIEYDPPSADGSLRQHDCLTGGSGYIGTPLGVNSCGAGAGTPTPTPTPACPAGTSDKTISVGFTAPPPPAPICITCSDGSSCCNGSTCHEDNDGNISCIGGSPPGLPPAASYATATCNSSTRENFACTSRGLSEYTTSPQDNNLRVAATVEELFGRQGVDGYIRRNFGAVFNFNTFSITKGSLIRKATLSSPTTGGFQAGFITGRIGNVVPSSSNPFYLPYYPSLPFGSGRIEGIGCANPDALWCKFFRSWMTDHANFCVQAADPKIKQGVSGLASGTADVTGFIQVSVNSQDLTALAFSLGPDYVFITPSGGCFHMSMATNFTVNTSGNAALEVTYCAATE